MSGALSGESTETIFITAMPFGKMLCPEAGDAYPFPVTRKRIRPHFDTVQKAFSMQITEPFLSST